MSFNTSRNICFGYLLESPHWGDSNEYQIQMFYKNNKNKSGLFLHIILLIKDSLQQQLILWQNPQKHVLSL